MRSRARTEFRAGSLQHAKSYHTTPLLAHGDAQYCSESAHLLLIQQQQTQGCLQHYLFHVLVVHAIGFCMSNTITCNSTIVTQGTHNPNSANPMLLIKAELTHVRIQHMRNQCTEKLGPKWASKLGEIKRSISRWKHNRAGAWGGFKSVSLTVQTSPSTEPWTRIWLSLSSTSVLNNSEVPLFVLFKFLELLWNNIPIQAKSPVLTSAVRLSPSDLLSSPLC